jgi:hypothetical protein
VYFLNDVEGRRHILYFLFFSPQAKQKSYIAALLRRLTPGLPQGSCSEDPPSPFVIGLLPFFPMRAAIHTQYQMPHVRIAPLWPFVTDDRNIHRPSGFSSNFR